MEKLSVLALVALCLFGSALSVEEKVEHGSHGAEKHKPVHFKHGKHNDVYDYEALMGSREHDELAELDEDVRRARLTTLAKSHDTNKNGLIESEELFQWVLHSFRVLDHTEAEEKRQEQDENDDGKISFHEILKKQFALSEEEIQEYEKRENKPADEDTETHVMIDEDKKRFHGADLDKDGLLDENEFIAFIHPYDFSHMHHFEIERAMKDLDENKDNLISMEEYLKVVAGDEEGQAVEVANFERYDTNKDGKLTPEELKPWAIFDNKESAKEEVTHLITECDEDKDGHLSIEEIVKKEEDFVASQATDYGRHLHFIREDL